MSFDWQDLIAGNLVDDQKIEERHKKPLIDFIDGEYLENSSIYKREKKFSVTSLNQGNEDFSLTVSLRKYAKVFLNKPLDIEKILFIDTETTGLNRSQGTFVFMLGIGQIRGDEFIITQYFVEEMHEETILYHLLEDLFRQTELFVSYNGKSFDIPLLQSRLILQRITLNIREIPHLDLLPIARRLWKTLVESFSLSCMEYRLLNKLREDDEDVPGFMIPELYSQYQQHGNPEKLIPVFYHNEDDISSLFSLFSMITRIFQNPLESSDNCWLNILEFGRLYEQIMHFDTALSLYKKAVAKDINGAEYHLAKLYKKTGQTLLALPLWEKMGDYDSLIDLAIWYEKNKEYQLAMQCCEKAGAMILSEAPLKILNELQKRIHRLKDKILKA